MHEEKTQINVPALRIEQPIGEYYIASISSKLLCEITQFDVRRIRNERDIETYLGIQRPLNNKRVKELNSYVNTVDACFPTAVILAIPGRCTSYDENQRLMTLENFPSDDEGERVLYREIAKVLDGQHRIEGLRAYEGDSDFQVNVSIFVDIDVAEQAYIFSTVNLAQTKVNKSLVYDLYDLAKSRSPQKLAHNIAVALDGHKDSPFYKRIKRLGRATEGRFGETITQAAFVSSLMKYLSDDEVKDRDIYMRGGKPEWAVSEESHKLIFRDMMLKEMDMEITDIIWNYFGAVNHRWPEAWGASGKGMILNKTNGFKALMRFLRDAYLYVASPGVVPSLEQFLSIFERVELEDKDFNVEKYNPGASGEYALYSDLVRLSGVDVVN